METDEDATTEFEVLFREAPLKLVPQLALDFMDIINFGDGKGTAFDVAHDGENTVVKYGEVSLAIKGPKARDFLRQIVTDRFLMGFDPEAFCSIMRAKTSKD